MDTKKGVKQTDGPRRDTTLQIDEPQSLVRVAGGGSMRKRSQLRLRARKAKRTSQRRKAHKTPTPTGAAPNAEQPVHIPGVEAVKPKGKEIHPHEDDDDDDEDYEIKEQKFYRKMFGSLMFMYLIPLVLLIWTYFSTLIKLYMMQPFGLLVCIMGIFLNLTLGYVHCTNTCTRDFPANYSMNVISSFCIYGAVGYISMKLPESFVVIMCVFFGVTVVAMINWITSLVGIKLPNYFIKYVIACAVLGLIFSGCFLLVVRFLLKIAPTGLQIGLTLVFGAIFNFLPYFKFYLIINAYSINVGLDEGPYVGWVLGHAYYTWIMVLVRKVETWK